MSNRFRTQPPAGFDHGRIEHLIEKAEELAQLLDKVGGREGSIANTHLETAVLFAVKGITK